MPSLNGPTWTNIIIPIIHSCFLLATSLPYGDIFRDAAFLIHSQDLRRNTFPYILTSSYCQNLTRYLTQGQPCNHSLAWTEQSPNFHTETGCATHQLSKFSPLIPLNVLNGHYDLVMTKHSPLTLRWSNRNMHHINSRIYPSNLCLPTTCGPQQPFPKVAI